jgi:DNA-binding transcriptional regulator GbsR (MarR family)
VKGGKTPTLIAQELKLSLPTVSTALRNLRQIDLVRYENMIDGKVYFIKDKTITSILQLLEKLVENIKSHEY